MKVNRAFTIIYSIFNVIKLSFSTDCLDYKCKKCIEDQLPLPHPPFCPDDNCSQDQPCISPICWGSNCDKKCGLGCVSCDKFTGCSGCKPGFIGSNCDRCAEGYYGTNCTECEAGCLKTCTEKGCDICKSSNTWGGWCEQICPQNCQLVDNRKCTRQLGTCLECETGFFSENCSKHCPENCDVSKKNCAFLSGNCDICNPGFYDINCKQCPPQCEMTCTTNGCDECKEQSKYGPFCNNDCPKNCKEDETRRKCDRSSGKCFECLDHWSGETCETCAIGFWGDACSRECPKGCNLTSINCDRSEGTCASCIDGYFGKFCDKCPDVCKTCKSDSKCDICQNLTQYGDLCNKQCSTGCKPVTEGALCQIDNGKCINGCEERFLGDLCDTCIKGYYQELCQTPCEKGCDIDQENCLKETGSCKVCKFGFWGAKCEAQCGNGCEVCNKADGTCTECYPGYYLAEDNSCVKCPDSCDGNCTLKEGCDKCKDINTYGLWCSDKCPPKCALTTPRCDRVEGTCFSCSGNFIGMKCDECIKGYFGSDCSIRCAKGCNIDLENCKKDGLCSNCFPGFFGLKCDQPCPVNCDISQVNCEKEYGTCTACKNGFWGNKCGDQCSSGCLICDQSEGFCTSCKDGYYITQENKCEPCHADCDGNCNLDNGCDKCKDVTHYGFWCDKKCPVNCIDGKCDRITGLCQCKKGFTGLECQDCENGLTGENCDQYCQEGCNITVENCSRVDGKCKTCKPGYFGVQCESICPVNCDVTKINCSKDKGSCGECKNGFWGTKCNESCSTGCHICEKDGGLCTHCYDNFYLQEKDKKCLKCPDTCHHNCTEKEGCEKCLSNINYGFWCQVTCPKDCVEPQGDDPKCNRLSGNCPKCKENFVGDKCENCIFGKYGDMCTKDCSKGCDLEKGTCKRDGQCDFCKHGFFGTACDSPCPEHCDITKGNCAKATGACSVCEDGYYTENCKKCKTECELKCSEKGCDKCIKGKYGDWCQDDCNEHCKGQKCEKETGFCLSCVTGFYGQKCELECGGCLKGCSRNGKCTGHLCKTGYYGGETCKEKCDPICENKGCDQYTSECNSCPKGKWGSKCEKDCSLDCETIECCSKDTIYPSYSLPLKKYFNFSTITIFLGTPPQKIEVLVDFSSSSPLAILDRNEDIVVNGGTKEMINPTYNCSASIDCIAVIDQSKVISDTQYVFIEGKRFSDQIYFDTKAAKIEYIRANKISFTQNITDPNFLISAVVGLGFFSDFNYELLNGKLLIKNVLTISGKNQDIQLGDYPPEIKRNIDDMSTCSPVQAYQYGSKNSFSCKVRGFTDHLKDAYIKEFNVTFSLSENNHIVLDLSMANFFQNGYFARQWGTNCKAEVDTKDEKVYYCLKSYDVSKLPNFGLVIGEYIYFLSPHELFEKDSSYHKLMSKSQDKQFFKIQLKNESNVVLGREFLSSYYLILFQGKGIIGFYGGERKKLNSELKPMKEWKSQDKDWLSPGSIGLLVIFTVVFVSVTAFVCYYCCLRRRRHIEGEDLLLGQNQ